MNNALSKFTALPSGTGTPASPPRFSPALLPTQLQHWAAEGLLTAMLFCVCAGCSAPQVAEIDNPESDSQSVHVSTTTVATHQTEQNTELPEPQQEASSPGLLGQAGKLLNDAKQASGQQASNTGQWLKGALDGASQSSGQAADDSLDWANKTFKTLKGQGLTTASSTGQWLSDDWRNMESWEYKVLPASSVSEEELENKLNELGKQGWECFSIDEQRMIFKKAPESYLRRLPFKDILRLAPLLNQGNQ